MLIHKNPLVRHSFLFGALVGGALISAALVFYLKGMSINFSPNLQTINYFLIVSGIFIGVKKYRDEVLFGIISYGRAFLAGIMIIGFAACFYSFFIYILTSYFDTGIIKEAIEFLEKSLVKAGHKEKDIELIMSVYNKLSPGMFAFGTWFSKALSGVFFSLILAFFFRQSRNLFNNKSNDKFNE